jgi:hypothetical protein
MRTGKKRCVVHGNCQADPLLSLLALSSAFSRCWETRLYINYTREAVPASSLEQCDLFLYQYLGEDWGELASTELLRKLPPQAVSICLPNLFFKGYWPFWTNASPMDFGDRLLDKLLEAGAEKPEILKIYYYGDVRRFADLEQNLLESLRLEREKEARGPIKTAGLQEELWREEMLFYTCNHPSGRLLSYVANELLRLLGLPALPESVAAFSPEYADFELPIHPQVASSLKLSFVGENQTYNIFGRKMNFLQYISRYIDCSLNGYADGFLGYLQLV